MPKIIFLEAVQNYGGARKSTVELAARLVQSNDVEIIDMYGTCVPFLQACDNVGLDVTVIDKRPLPFMISSGNKFKLLWNYIYFIFHILKVNSRLVAHICKNEEAIIVVNNSKVLICSYSYKQLFTPINILLITNKLNNKNNKQN